MIHHFHPELVKLAETGCTRAVWDGSFFEYHDLRILRMAEAASRLVFARVVEPKEVLGTLDPKA